MRSDFLILKHGRVDEGFDQYMTKWQELSLRKTIAVNAPFSNLLVLDINSRLDLVAWKRAHSVEGRQAFPGDAAF